MDGGNVSAAASSPSVDLFTSLFQLVSVRLMISNMSDEFCPGQEFSPAGFLSATEQLSSSGAAVGVRLAAGPSLPPPGSSCSSCLSAAAAACCDPGSACSSAAMLG